MTFHSGKQFCDCLSASILWVQCAPGLLARARPLPRLFAVGDMMFCPMKARVVWLTVLTILGWLLGSDLLVYGQDDLVIADFEGKDYGAWSTLGEAFGTGPAQGALPDQMHVDGYLGKGLVNSYHGGDSTTGELVSPKFKVERNYIAFLIGGGMDLEKTCLQLVINGETVRVATGNNNQPGGSESLQVGSWDVKEYLGKEAAIRIVDQATGGWGHINVDHIVQTDRRPPGMLIDVPFEVHVIGRYLHIPIKNGAPKRVVKFSVDGELIVRNDIELAVDQVDWWASMDVTQWKGKTLVLNVDQYPEGATGLSSVIVSDREPAFESLYQEEFRGAFHFSPKRGWNNDPNGLVFFNGEYHLFFQHNPYGWGWGNMHWGHAVSRDLVHWEELGDKLWPDAMGPMFSGSAVVDWKNSSGLGRDGKPPMLLFYTAAGTPTVQCMAYSLDGRTFTKYEENPIVPQITGGNRDPKVFWYEPGQHWVMVLYVTLDGGRHTVHILTSANLRQWEVQNIVEGEVNTNFLYECPDFFELAIDGDPSKRMWVMLGANSEYGLGTFDGSQFRMQEKCLPGHRGRGFYAAQSFSDIPREDGRRIMIGWFQTPTPGMPFNQSMTMPLEVGLKSTEAGPRLTFLPVKEMKALRGDSKIFSKVDIERSADAGIRCDAPDTLELHCGFKRGVVGKFCLNVRGIDVVCDFDRKELKVHDHTAMLGDVSKEELTIFVDRQGLEVFASEGLCYIPLPFIVDRSSNEIRIDGQSTKALEELRLFELMSIWKE